MIILVMGLSGAGKTWLASRLARQLNWPHFDGDEVRKLFNNWSFNEVGRLQQTEAIKYLTYFVDNCVCSYICPQRIHRLILSPDRVIWMDTVESSKFSDTDNIFEPPEKFHIRLVDHITEDQIPPLAKRITGPYVN